MNLVVTHNTRLRCLCENIIPGFNKKIRFQNCAVIQLLIGITTASCQMVYDGKLGEHDANRISDERKYYTLKPSGSFYEQFPQISNSEELHKKIFGGKIAKKPFVVYLVRHGEGYHNTETGISKQLLRFSSGDSHLRDAELTRAGIDQAIHAGTYFKKNKINLDFAFVSTLMRSRQTAAYILDLLEHSQQPLYVLPHAHEVNEKSCEKPNAVLSPENDPKCSQGSDKFYGGELCNEVKSHKVVWESFNYEPMKNTANMIQAVAAGLLII